MDIEDIQALNSIADRAKREGAFACGSALLEYFMALANSGKVREFAESFCLFVDDLPDCGPFLSDTLPLILAAHYPPLATAARQRKLLAWMDRIPSWRERLSDTLREPQRFEQDVRGLVFLVED